MLGLPKTNWLVPLQLNSHLKRGASSLCATEAHHRCLRVHPGSTSPMAFDTAPTSLIFSVSLCVRVVGCGPRCLKKDGGSFCWRMEIFILDEREERVNSALTEKKEVNDTVESK